MVYAYKTLIYNWDITSAIIFHLDLASELYEFLHAKYKNPEES